MRQIKIIMGMPVTLEIVDSSASNIFEEIFAYFKQIDQKFSTFKKNSEITKINDGRLQINECSDDMKTIFQLAERTKKETDGYFDIYYNGRYDPSGIVKGWSILNAADILKKAGFRNFYVDAGGDIQVAGKNSRGKNWTVGIKNPFKEEQIVKVVVLKNQGIATSGSYIRGDHIYDPKNGRQLKEIISLTVIGPNVYEADRFATAAFAMGKKGINFIDSLEGFEGYMINKEGLATVTSGFEKYEVN